MDPHAAAPIASETTKASPKTPQAPGLRASRSGHVRGAVVALAALATAASSGCGGALPGGGGAASSTSASTPADAAVVRFAQVGYRGVDEVQIEKEVQELLAR